jgi:hypothetical protein
MRQGKMQNKAGGRVPRTEPRSTLWSYLALWSGFTVGLIPSGISPGRNDDIGSNVVPVQKAGWAGMPGFGAKRTFARSLTSPKCQERKRYSLLRNTAARSAEASASQSAKSSEHLRPPNAPTISETQAIPNLKANML